MTDLACLTLRLRPTHSDTIPANTGRAAQAWYLASLRQINPTLSQAIHDGSEQKPFTASGLIGEAVRDTLRLSRGKPVSLRVTTLHPDVTRLTVNTLQQMWLRDGVTLHDQHLVVESVDVQTDTYAGLLSRYSASPSLRRSLTLHFALPTYFKKTGDRQVPLPLPEYVFGSLIDRWKAFSPGISLNEGLREWLINTVDITDLRIHTQRVDLERAGRGSFTGFIGNVTFAASRIGDNPACTLAQLHTLADFARYSGVGARTTNGFGAVERAYTDAYAAPRLKEA